MLQQAPCKRSNYLTPPFWDSHRTNAMAKLDLHDAQAVTRFAIRRGLCSRE